MGSLSVSDITRILQTAGIAIVVLLILLIFVRLTTWVLRHLFRKTMSPDNTDLIGQEAVVRRTVRSQRPGEIECEWKGQILNGKAISDRTIRSGRTVLILSVQGEYFKVRPVEIEYFDVNYDKKET